jgi:hypothetical protein
MEYCAIRPIKYCSWLKKRKAGIKPKDGGRRSAHTPMGMASGSRARIITHNRYVGRETNRE